MVADSECAGGEQFFLQINDRTFSFRKLREQKATDERGTSHGENLRDLKLPTVLMIGTHFMQSVSLPEILSRGKSWKFPSVQRFLQYTL